MEIRTGGSKQVRRPVVIDHIALERVADAVKIRTKSIHRRAARRIAGRHAVGKPSGAVNSNSNIVARDDNIGARVLGVKLQRVIVSEQRRRHSAADDVPLLGVVDSVPVHADDRVVARPPNFNRPFKGRFDVRWNIRIECRIVILLSVGQHLQKITGDAVVLSLENDRDRRNTGNDIELGPGIRRFLGHSNRHAADENPVRDDVVSVFVLEPETSDAVRRTETKTALPVWTHPDPTTVDMTVGAPGK